MTVMVLVGDAVRRAKISAALRELAAAPSCCSTIRDARTRLRTEEVRAVLVSARDREGMYTGPLVSEVRQTFPTLPVLAYCTFGETPSGDMVGLVRAGAHELVVCGVDDERQALSAALRAAEQTVAADLVLEAVRARVPPTVWPLIEMYLRRPAEPLTVARSARQLGVDRKTLLNRLQAVGYPAPAEVRAWCRLFVAARLLERSGRTVESVALQLEFQSGSALRNLLKRHTGLSPKALRSEGALQLLLDRFHQGRTADPGRPRGRTRAATPCATTRPIGRPRTAAPRRTRVAESTVKPAD